MVALGVRPSWRVIWKHLQEQPQPPAGLQIPEQPVGAGESSGALLKVSLALILLESLAHWKSATELSVACSYTCPSRAKESLLAIVIIVLMLEGLPALMVRLDVVSRYSAWLLILKQIRQDRDGSILMRLTQEEGTKLQSHQSSAMSFVIIATVGLLLGGNFGTFMTKPCFWICWTILIGESIAEGIYRFPLRMQRNRNGSSPTHAVDQTAAGQDDNRSSAWQHRAINLFRGLVQGSLSISLIIIVARDDFYPSNLPDSVCDPTCRRNTKGMLIVTCACSIAQAVSLQVAPLQSFSVLLVLPLLLYSVLAVIIGVSGSIALIAVAVALAGSILAVIGAVVAGIVGVEAAVGAAAMAAFVLYAVVRFIVHPCLLHWLGIDGSCLLKWMVAIYTRKLYKTKLFGASVLGMAFALAVMIASLIKREWPWFLLKHLGTNMGHFFSKLWKGMTHQ